MDPPVVELEKALEQIEAVGNSRDALGSNISMAHRSS